MKHRGGFGVTCYNITEKSGALTGVAAVDDNDDLMLITDSGTIIRTPVSGIPSRSRSAGGVIVMRLGEGQSLVNFTKVAREDEAENDMDALEDTDAIGSTETIEVTEASEATEATDSIETTEE